MVNNNLVGGWALPLWKMMEFVSWDCDIPDIWKKCSKPLTSHGSSSFSPLKWISITVSPYHLLTHPDAWYVQMSRIDAGTSFQLSHEPIIHWPSTNWRPSGWFNMPSEWLPFLGVTSWKNHPMVKYLPHTFPDFDHSMHWRAANSQGWPLRMFCVVLSISIDFHFRRQSTYIDSRHFNIVHIVPELKDSHHLRKP